MENKEQKANFNIVIVNNNYDKMASRRRNIIKSNEDAIEVNEKIDKTRKRNFATSLISSFLLSAAFCLFIWFNIDFGFMTKLVLCGISVLCIFVMIEHMASISNAKLENKRKTIVTIDEPIEFTTFIKNKNAVDYSVTSYSDVPYETQYVYFTLTLEDRDGKRSTYKGLNKWNLVLLPVIFDVVIDAESMTIYIPYENEGPAKDKIRIRMNEEQLEIEKEARIRAEKELALVNSEKETIERILAKQTATSEDLRRTLKDVQEKLDTSDTRFANEKQELLSAINIEKEKTSTLNASFVTLKKEFEEKCSENESLTTSLKVTSDKLEESSKNTDNAVKKIQENETTIAQLRNKLFNTENILSESRERANGLQKDLQESNEKCANLTQEATNKQNEIDGLVAKTQSLEKRVELLHKDNETLKEEVESAKSAGAAETEALEKRLTEKENSEIELKAKNETLEREIANRQNLLIESNKKAEAFEKELKSVREECASLAQKVEEKNSEAQSLNGVILDLKNNLKEKEALETSFKEENSILKNELEKSKNNPVNQEVSDKLNDTEKRLEESKVKIAKLEKDIESANAVATEKQEVLSKRVEGKHIEVQQLTTKVTELEQQVETLRQNNNNLTKDLAAANEIVANGSGDLKKHYESRIEHLTTQNQNITSQYENKMTELQKRHESDMESFKEKLTIAVKEAKDALEKRHAEEVSVLKAENEKLTSGTALADITRDLNETRESLKKEIATRTAREKELDFEREKIKNLEQKVREADSMADRRVNEVVEEKKATEKSLRDMTEKYEKIKKAKETSSAAAGVQERALLKDKEVLSAKVKDLETQLGSMKDYPSVKEENSKLKKRIEELRNEDVENVKKECQERISLMKEENEKMEKKMREALEQAAKEKADRIKSEDAFRQYKEDEKKAEYDKKIAAQEAEIAKARERAQKAQDDAMNARIPEKVEAPKRPPRHLNY